MKAQLNLESAFEVISLINEAGESLLPLGFQLIRRLDISNNAAMITAVPSQFHQTDFFEVGHYYKPIAHLLDEKEILA